MGVFCGHAAQLSEDSSAILLGLCHSSVQGLRSAKCAVTGKSVLEELKHRLECDVFNSVPALREAFGLRPLLFVAVASTKAFFWFI